MVNVRGRRFVDAKCPWVLDAGLTLMRINHIAQVTIAPSKTDQKLIIVSSALTQTKVRSPPL